MDSTAIKLTFFLELQIKLGTYLWRRRNRKKNHTLNMWKKNHPTGAVEIIVYIKYISGKARTLIPATLLYVEYMQRNESATRLLTSHHSLQTISCWFFNYCVYLKKKKTSKRNTQMNKNIWKRITANTTRFGSQPLSEQYSNPRFSFQLRPNQSEHESSNRTVFVYFWNFFFPLFVINKF